MTLRSKSNECFRNSSSYTLSLLSVKCRLTKIYNLNVTEFFSRYEYSERCKKKQDFINLCTVKKGLDIFW